MNGAFDMINVLTLILLLNILRKLNPSHEGADLQGVQRPTKQKTAYESAP